MTELQKREATLLAVGLICFFSGAVIGSYTKEEVIYTKEAEPVVIEVDPYEEMFEEEYEKLEIKYNTLRQEEARFNTLLLKKIEIEKQLAELEKNNIR